ncbi:MAG TPA: hypothetical protein VEO95_05815, partial [Chthoniobacteraceae bacterium]|nr:hypothetical protein [Chthoniobacteraceae bacterium]
HAAFFRGAKLDLSLRERVGQMGFLAALSGFRALVADALWIHANMAWERTEWGTMKLDFDTVTTLQPRCVLFWEMAAWHMSANASVAALENRKQPREALRIKAQREYWKLGEDYLRRGIANNPESPKLHVALGNLYADRIGDHCKAAAEYAEAAKLPKAPVYVHRFAAYQLAQCPGHEREAYELLLSYYKLGEDERLPTLLKWLGYLQEKLNVPPEQKVYIPPPANP